MNKSNVYISFGALALMLGSEAAFADLAYIDPGTGQNVFDQVAQKFFNKAKGWHVALEAAAIRLFWSLVLISMVWTFGMMILRKADLGDFFAEFTRFIIFTGFFFWLLTNAVSGHNIGGTIIDSMQVLGNQASGQAGSSHGNIMDVAINIWHDLLRNLSLWNPVDSFVAFVLTLIIVIILTIVAVNMLFLLIASWVLLYAGIFFLGFGGARWTSDMAINYFRTVLSVGIQLLVMTLIVGIGSDFLTNFSGNMNQNTMNFEELGVMLIFAVAFYILVSKIPPLVSGIVTNSGFNSSGVSNFGGGQVMGAAATSMAVASMGISTAATAMTSIAAKMSGGNSIADTAEAAASMTPPENSFRPRKNPDINPFKDKPVLPS